jgi:hypothetical protein
MTSHLAPLANQEEASNRGMGSIPLVALASWAEIATANPLWTLPRTLGPTQ